MTHLSIADLYAIKSQAKEKEAYYRTIKIAAPEDPYYTEQQKKYATILYHADKELSTRLDKIYDKQITAEG